MLVDPSREARGVTAAEPLPLPLSGFSPATPQLSRRLSASALGLLPAAGQAQEAGETNPGCAQPDLPSEEWSRASDRERGGEGQHGGGRGPRTGGGRGGAD